MTRGGGARRGAGRLAALAASGSGVAGVGVAVGTLSGAGFRVTLAGSLGQSELLAVNEAQASRWRLEGRWTIVGFQLSELEFQSPGRRWQGHICPLF